MSQNTNPKIPFARPKLGVEEENAVLEVLRSGWLTTGKQCFALENEFAAMVGMPFALAVNSATSGMHLALEALGIGPEDRIAISPYTFTASCEVMRYLGAHPWFVDIDERTFHLDPVKLERDLERSKRGEIPAIKAVMTVHIAGIGVSCPEVYEIAARYGIPVVEDAAHAFPARSANYGPAHAAPGEHYLGTGGTIGVYSFYANKTITTGEGGMIVCRDEALVKRMKLMRLHGMDRDVWQRYTSNAAQWRYDVVAPGFKYNLPDVAAAVGREQLKKADAFMRERHAIAERYIAAFSKLPWIVLPPLPARSGEHSWHLFTIRVDQGKAGFGRDELIAHLTEAGVGTSVHFIPLNHMTYYRNAYGVKPEDFPNATRAFEACVSLPIYPGLSVQEQDYVIDAVRKIADTH